MDTETKLSLSTRKNIKDYEPKLQDHLAKIAKLSGITFEVEVADWAGFAEAAEASKYKDRAGEIIYNLYMKALANNIELYVRDEIQKESLVEVFGAKHLISFFLQTESVEGRSQFVFLENRDGVLTVNVMKAKINCNTAETGNVKDLARVCSGEGPMTVLARKNVKDKEVDMKKHLARIQKVTGVEFTVEVDWQVIATHAAASGLYTDRPGDVIYASYLPGLAGNLERLCKDDMVKEAVVEAAHKKVISFSVVPDSEVEGKNPICKFADGTLQVIFTKASFNVNAQKTGADIQSRL
jgi:hypothetical protein